MANLPTNDSKEKMEGENRLRLSQTQLANSLTAQVKSVDMVSPVGLKVTFDWT